MDQGKQNLTHKTLNATKWNYLGTIGRIFSQLLVTVVLARILGPEAFGMFAVIILVTGIAGIIADMGLGSALIQKKSITNNEVHKTFTLIVLFSTGIAFVIVILTPLITDWLKFPEMKSVFRGGALYLVIFSIGIVPSSLLKRELNMKAIQISQLTSYIVGFLIVGIGCAVLGVGNNSLVVAYITQAAIYSYLTYSLSSYKIVISFEKDISELRSYGKKVMMNNISNWVTENADNLLIGKFFGIQILGLYTVSYNLLRTPTNHIVSTLQAVIFSAASRVQKDNEKLAYAYLSVTGLISLISFPLFIGAACIPETIIRGLYGDKWVEAIPFFTPLAIAMLFHALLSCTGPVLSGKGDIKRELVVQVIVAVLLIISILIASRMGFYTVAWAVMLVYWIRLLLLTYQTKVSLSLSWGRVINSIQGGLIVSLFSSMNLIFVDSLLTRMSISSTIILIMDILVSGASVILVMIFMKNYLYSKEVIWLFTQVCSRFPNSHGFLKRLFLPKVIRSRIIT